MWLQKPPLGVGLDFKNDLNTGLVMHLTTNEGHGDKVYDLSKYGNHGTLHNFTFPPTVTSGWNPGFDGHTLLYDGSNDYINVGNRESLNNITDELTVEVLIRCKPDGGANRILDKGGIATGWYLRLWDPETYITFKIDDGTHDVYATTTIEYGDNTLHHIIGVLDNRTSIKLYVDGIEAASANPSSVGSIANTEDLNIGRDNGNTDYFKGSIPLIRILKRAYTAKEVLQRQIDPYGVYLQN